MVSSFFPLSTGRRRRRGLEAPPEHRLAYGLSLEAIDEFLAELAARARDTRARKQAESRPQCLRRE